VRFGPWLSSEGPLHEFRFVGARLVVGIDQRGLEVAVAHPLLECAQRHPGGSHAGAEGMAQVVEAHLPNAGAVEVLLESLQRRPSRQRPAGARVAKDQIVILLEDRPLEVAVEFAGNPVRQRNGAA
jgi:hypothetical protein